MTKCREAGDCAPVPIRPHGLWSLWELIEKHAGYFNAATMELTELKWLAVTLANSADDEARKKPTVRDELVARGYHAVHAMRVACIYADMQDLIPALNRMDATLKSMEGADWDFTTIGHQVNHLVQQIRDQLDQQFFFHVDQPDVPLYMATEPFGQLVGLKFPQASEDITEAAKCLALQRPTACVFHLMRVLELGVRAFGKKLRIRIADPRNETWANIVRLVNQKIEAMPTKTRAQQARKQELASASANLNAVRIATRNEVMHPKQTYTREDAHTLYDATRVFMDHFAGLV